MDVVAHTKLSIFGKIVNYHHDHIFVSHPWKSYYKIHSDSSSCVCWD
jgi:hypothetical protein